jgi:hypothetical protein
MMCSFQKRVDTPRSGWTADFAKLEIPALQHLYIEWPVSSATKGRDELQARQVCHRTVQGAGAFCQKEDLESKAAMPWDGTNGRTAQAAGTLPILVRDS